MDVGTAIGFGGLVIAGVGIWLAWSGQRVAKRDESRDLFARTSALLKAERGNLANRFLANQLRFQFDDKVPLLTQSGWIPNGPVSMNSMNLSIRASREDETIGEARRRLLRYWPGGSGQRRFPSYSAALEDLAPPASWFNGCSYRLLEINVPESDLTAQIQPNLDLVFSLGHYFDGLDTTEALAYEAAHDAVYKRRDLSGGKYRRWLGSPFRLNQRSALLGVNILTLRVDGDRVGFFLHQRHPARVASAMNTTHVVPAGEFQPHSDSLPVWASDLNLWYTAMREYAEEYLGVAEASGDTGVSIDYEIDEPYASLNRALLEGHAKLRFLGIGLDPLSWKPEACLVCIWDAVAFDSLFSKMLTDNAEGKLLVGHRNANGSFDGMDFSEENVLGYAQRSDVLPAGRACLELAWRWRGELGLQAGPR
jgi:hypothetical protein